MNARRCRTLCVAAALLAACAVTTLASAQSAPSAALAHAPVDLLLDVTLPSGVDTLRVAAGQEFAAAAAAWCEQRAYGEEVQQQLVSALQQLAVAATTPAQVDAASLLPVAASSIAVNGQQLALELFPSETLEGAARRIVDAANLSGVENVDMLMRTIIVELGAAANVTEGLPPASGEPLFATQLRLNTRPAPYQFVVLPGESVVQALAGFLTRTGLNTIVTQADVDALLEDIMREFSKVEAARAEAAATIIEVPFIIDNDTMTISFPADAELAPRATVYAREVLLQLRARLGEDADLDAMLPDVTAQLQAAAVTSRRAREAAALAAASTAARTATAEEAVAPAAKPLLQDVPADVTVPLRLAGQQVNLALTSGQAMAKVASGLCLRYGAALQNAMNAAAAAAGQTEAVRLTQAECTSGIHAILSDWFYANPQ